MNKPVIVCFSHSNEHLKNLIAELSNYFGSAIDQSSYQHKESLLHSIQTNILPGQEKKLFVIDVRDSNTETVRFIESINKFCPTAIKLIIAENHHISQIRKFIVSNRTLQYLSSPWTVNELNIALKSVSQNYSNLKPAIKKTRHDLSFNEKVEEKVNERLQKLIDSNRAKDNFLSIITHDLKNPFNALSGISEILINDWDTLSEETKLDFIGDIHKTADETYKLLVNLLEWSKLQKEKLEVTINEVKIHNLVDTTLKVNESNASVKGIKIQNKIDDNIKVHTDENMIATVFRNLISNAMQYTQPGGNINITAKEEKDFCTFCVADNGSGIDKPHILELFNKGSRKKLNGNASAFKGLGLILCKDFVEKNGGQIWLETQKGEGSKFFFTVPN
jgi:signal transduction histidine kinase